MPVGTGTCRQHDFEFESKHSSPHFHDERSTNTTHLTNGEADLKHSRIRSRQEAPSRKYYCSSNGAFSQRQTISSAPQGNEPSGLSNKRFTRSESGMSIHNDDVSPVTLQWVQGESTMFNTFQAKTETASRIIMDRKLRLEQVRGVATDDADDDKKEAICLLGDTSPSHSIEAFLDLGHQQGYIAHTEPVHPTISHHPSYLHTDTATWSPSGHTYCNPTQSSEDPFVGTIFHPVENTNIDSIPFDTDEEIPYDAPETNGEPRLPFSSFFTGEDMVKQARDPPGADVTTNSPNCTAIVAHRKQEDKQRHAATKTNQNDSTVTFRDGKHWNTAEDSILKQAMTDQGPIVDWDSVSIVFFAGSRSAHSVCWKKKLTVIDKSN
jgi:hypothetical protein